MNSTNLVKQGAVKVAQSRLRTIDQALAKLEALVPADHTPSPSGGNTPMSPPSTNTARTEFKSAAAPTPMPHSSLQALEAFVAGA